MALNDQRHRTQEPWCAAAALTCAALLMSGCGAVRNYVPFLPPSNFVDVGGRMLSREEIAYYEEIKAHNKYAKIDPNSGVSYNALGELFQRKGHYPFAKELYVEAIGKDPTLSEAHHNLGVITLYEENYKDAQTHLTRAHALSPNDARIHHHLGLSYDGLGQHQAALQSFDKALVLDPEHSPAYLDKARTLYRLAKYREAEDVCRKAIANLPKVVVAQTAGDNRSELLKMIWPSGTDPSRPDTAFEEAHYDLALCLKAQGRHAEALTALVPAEQSKLSEVTRADVQTLKARLLEASGNRGAAIATLDVLRKEYPAKAAIVKQLARLYQENGQLDLAVRSRLEAAELDHSDRALQFDAARDAEARKDFPQQIAVYERLTRLDPADLDSRRKLARAYDQAGIVRQAALTYQEVVSRAPEDLLTVRRLGILYADLPGFQGRAVLQFKRVLAVNPKDAEVLRRMGELHLVSKNPSEAEKYLREALKLTPNDPLVHKATGDLYVMQRRGEDAVQAYRRALELKPELVEIQWALARVMLSVDLREDAIKPLEIYLLAKPDDVDARRSYADALRDLNRRAEAVKQYQTIIELRPRDEKTTKELAKLATLLGQRGEAAGMYEAILEKDPSDLDALRSAARLYDDQKQPLRAMYCWQRLLKFRSEDQEGLAALAADYRAIGDEDAAIRTYEVLGHADAWRNVAFLRLKRNEPKLARAAYRKIIALNKSDGPARAGLAGLLQLSENETEREEAVLLYQELLQLDPKDTRARVNLANLLTESNRFAEAQEQFEHALRLDKQHAAAHVGLGVILRKRGKLNEAKEHYQAALQSDPNCKLAHFNMGLLCDFHLEKPDEARTHYDRFVRLGGDPKLLPKADGAGSLGTPDASPTRKPGAEVLLPAEPVELQDAPKTTHEPQK